MTFHRYVRHVVAATMSLICSGALAQSDADIQAALEALRASKSDAMSPAEREELREQLLTFAPYASMHSRFETTPSGGTGAAAVLTDWTELRELDESVFDARVQLQTAYRDLRAFMVRTEGSALPMLRSISFPTPSIDPVASPEMALAELMFFVSAEMSRNAALKAWSRDHDETCRAAYARILPLLRQVVDDTDDDPEYVRLRHWFVEGQGVFLEALNVSGRPLHNVTLVVRFATLDGSDSEHYYFIPEWTHERDGNEGYRYPLRMASDWAPVGAAATTSATVEVISDEYSERMLKFEFDDHIPTAADHVLKVNDSILATKKQHAVVIANARIVERNTRAYPERLARAKAQRALAQERLNAVLGALDAKIETLKEKQEEITPSNIRWKRRSREERSEARMELQEQINTLQAEKTDWQSGRR